MPVKIFAAHASPGELGDSRQSLCPLCPPQGSVDLFTPIGKQLATAVTTKIVNFVVSTVASKPKKETGNGNGNGAKSDGRVRVKHRVHAIDAAVARMAENQRPAVRALVGPRRAA